MERCSLCPGVNACLPVNGPDDADLLFVGEAPGWQENKRGRVFIGRSGDEVNRHYLPLAGLRRDRVAFTNAIRCFPVSAGGKLDPKKAKDLALLDSCARCHLDTEIFHRSPRLIIALGSFACKALALEGTLDDEHGIPQETPYGRVFPMYHPALGMYEPKKMLLIRNDWIRLKRYLAGKLPALLDPYQGQEDYQEVTDASQLAEIEPTTALGCDTESDRTRSPYCLTFSTQPGSGRLIRASRPDLLRRFQHHLDLHRAPILFHNWFYDWAVTESMGLQFPHRLMVDTMAEAYRLGNLPQGLKALAYRELGMVMQDFEDLVIPYSREHVLNYYRIAQLMDWPKPDPDLVMDEKTGLWKPYKPQGMSTKLKRFFTDYSNNPDKDVFSMWEDNWTDQQQMIEAKIGKWPGMCISHVPFDQTLHYACRDADALVRLWPVLKQMQARVRKFPQHEWRVA